MWKLDYKESWVPNNWCFWTVILEKTLESLLDCGKSNQSILKEISPEYSLEGLMLKLKPNTLATWCEELTHWKRPWCLERMKPGERDTEDEMVRWHHRLDGHEFGQAPGAGYAQGSPVCYSPRGRTQLSNWTELNYGTQRLPTAINHHQSRLKEQR